MYVSELKYRFWLPSQRKFIYPDQDTLLIEVDEEGNQEFFLGYKGNLRDIDEDYIAQAMSNYELPSGKLYEGDIIKLDGSAKPIKLDIVAPEGLQIKLYEDYEVDFYVERSENHFISLSEVNLEEVELVGDIFNGIWVEDPFTTIVEKRRKEIIAERRQRLMENVEAIRQKVLNNSSTENEFNNLIDEATDDEDDDIPNSDYDGEIEENPEEEEIQLSSDNEKIVGLNNTKITVTNVNDILSGEENPEIKIIDVSDISTQEEENDEFDDEIEFDDDDDYDWTEDDLESTDLFNRNSTKGFEELFIRSSIDRELHIGAWAVGMYHFGLSQIISEFAESSDVNYLQMLALKAALAEIEVPSTIRVNIENGFLRKLLNGKLESLRDNDKYKDLYIELLDDSSRHNFVFIDENPHSRKIESRIAADQAQEVLNEHRKQIS